MDNDLQPVKPMRKSEALIYVRVILGSHGFVRVTPQGEKQAGTFEHGFECMATGSTWEEVLNNLRSNPQSEVA